MNNQLSLYDALAFAFKRFVDHLIFIIGVGLVLFGLVSSVALSGLLVGALIKGTTLGFHEVLACLPNAKQCISQFFIPVVAGASFIALFIFAWLYLGYVRVMFDIHDTNSASFSTLFSQGRKMFTYLAALIMYLLLILCGFALLVIPGIIVMYRFGFFTLAIVDKNLGPINALKYSWNLTKDHNKFSFGLWLVFSIINHLAGIFALVSGGLGHLTLINGYRQLQNQVREPQKLAQNQ